MPDEIIVRHEIDLGQLEKFESALREFKDTGSVKEITAELKKQVTEHQKINKETEEEWGIVGKLLQRQKELRNEQKYVQTEKELKAINKELRQVQKELKKAKDTTAGWATALGSFQFKFNALGNIAANITSTIANKLNSVLRDTVDIAREFESAMAGVKAITGATDEEFKKLERDAIRLGGATIYTATQVAQLQMNYAKLGFTTNEILNATEATLSLAAATDEGLAEAALVAGSTLRAFQMDAIETQRVVDVMAKSFTSSALNLEHWKESMKFAASIAEGAGLTIETTAAAFAVLADAGIKGSIAGTSLKNILLRMSDANSKLSRTVGFAVRNSEDFIRALEILNQKGTDLTEVFELTDRRAAPALRILIEMTEAVRNAKDEFDGAAGAAKEMADVRMDTLKGSITILKSAWEGLVLSLEQGTNIFSVHLRKIVDWVTKVIMKVKELTLDDEEFIKQWGEFEGSKMVQEFSSSLTTSKDRLGDVQAEMERVRKELELLESSQKEANDLIKSGAEETTIEIEKEKTLWEKITDGVRQFGDAAAVANGKMTSSTYIARREEEAQVEVIKVGSKEFKAQKEEIDKRTAAMRSYFNELFAWYSRLLLLKQQQQEEEPTGEIPGQIIDVVDVEKVKKRLDDTVNYWLKVQRELIAADIARQRREIILSDETNETKKRMLEDLLDEQKGLEYLAEKEAIEAKYATFPELKAYYDARLKFIEEWFEGIGVEIEEASDPKTGIWATWYKEVDRAVDYIIDALQSLNDQEQKLLDERIDRYDTNISELQKSLDHEYDLRKDGFANRVDLLNKEIEEQKALRDRALREKERAIEKERRLNAAMQISNLAVTASDIFLKAQEAGSIWGWLVALVSVAAMIGAFTQVLGDVRGAASYAEGGWIDGDPHSRGGKWINAEGGEFVIRKNVAHKYPDILEALNKDDIHSVWNDLNMSLNRENIPVVNMNNTKTEELLTRLIELNEEMPRDLGDGYITFKKDGVIYRINKNGK